MALEKQYRLNEAGRVTGYSVAALRKKIANREVGHRKTGRIVTIPESELNRILGEYQEPVSAASR